VLAVPLRAWRSLPLAQLAGRVVVDVMNYWPPVDGILPEFQTDRPSSQIVRDGLPPTARLVKTFNHIGYHDIEELARPAGSPDRVAVAIAGDDPEAVALVAQFVDDLGFDPVPVGDLAASLALQPGSPIFGANLDRDALLAAIEPARQPN
jgi:predicted dinucleotide-binding enzyme